MSKLIKNELIKIFNKKAIYVMLIITIAFGILNNVLNKVFENDNYDMYSDENLKNYENMLDNLEKNPKDEYYKENYIEYQTSISEIKLGQKYEKNSWQRYIIERDVAPLIREMFYNEDNKEDLQIQYDNIIEKLNSNDWKYFAYQDLENTDSEIEKQALRWRLEKDIDYGSSPLNTYIYLWTYYKNVLQNYDEAMNTKSLEYSRKYDYQEKKEALNICEYAIKNNINEAVLQTNDVYYINNSNTNLPSNAKLELINSFDTYSFFIIIITVMIAGTIVSEEFNKGTVKLLLVRPYKRSKILLAKFLTCLIILILTFVFVVVIQTVIGGIVYGFDSLASPIPVYNFNTNSLETIGILKYLILLAITKLPMFILLMTLAFALSVTFNNSPLAIALPLLGIMGANIINSLAYSFEKAKFLMFFVTPNWDLSIYLFGKIPQFEPISLPFSIIVCIVYFIIMTCVSNLVFKKREIKNI